MTNVQLTTDFEKYLYNLVEGKINCVILERDFIIIQTDVDNYKLYYNEIK